jgi:hypothetical protein
MDPVQPHAPAQPGARKRRRQRREQAALEGQCLGTSKRSGKRCQNKPVPGRPTCRMHGGTGGAPILHGRFSELRGRVRASYLASLNDDSLFDHAQTIALLDGLVKEACARAADLDTPKFREIAVDKVEAIELLLTLGKDAALAIHGLATFLKKGLDQVVAEERLFRLVERMDARITEANRLKLSKQNSINAVDLTGVMQSLLAAVLRLGGPELAKLIADEIAKILGGVDVAPPSRETLVGRN